MNIEVYIGSVIENESERAILVALPGALAPETQWTIVLANFHCGARQFDFVVATDTTTCVIEAKHFARRVKGTANGDWETLTAGGTWKPVGNPYKQVLDAKNILRDELRKFAPHLPVRAYPNACVAVAPSLPAGSEPPPSDLKVEIRNADQLGETLRRPSSLVMPQESWHAFAEKLRLQQTEDIGSIVSHEANAREKMLSDYAEAFFKTYQPDAAILQQDTYFLENKEISLDELLDWLIHDDSDIGVIGPSGCGKTLLAKRISVQCAALGMTTLFLQGKYFDGKLADAIHREATLLGAPSGTKLVAAARRCGRPLIIVMDGYNECPKAEQEILTRSLAAFSHRHHARIIVASQEAPMRQDLLDYTKVSVQSPSQALKEAIARASAAALPKELTTLLETVSSGLEAAVAGSLRHSLPAGASRFSLFDAYFREILGEHAVDGIRLLTALAGQMTEHLSFNNSIREIDRLAERHGIDGKGLAAIYASKLISRHADKVSFGHELYLAAFTAEWVARTSCRDIDSLIATLKSPKLRASREFVIGTIEDDQILHGVLHGIADAKLLWTVLQGSCGMRAQNILKARRKSLLEKAKEEAAGARFSLGSDHFHEAEIVPESVFEWSAKDLAFMQAIADSDWLEEELVELLNAIGAMDQSINRAKEDLRQQHGDQIKNPTSRLFAAAYAQPPEPTAVSQIVTHIASGGSFWPRRKRYGSEHLAKLLNDTHSFGQAHLLICLANQYEDRLSLAPYILSMLRTHWRRLPAHLKLQVLHFVRFIPEPQEQLKQELIGALEDLLPQVDWLSSATVIEALERLGALDDDAERHKEVVRKELQDLLRQEPVAETFSRAWGLYCCQFDHPYDSSYYEVVQDLPPADLRRFLVLACHGADRAGLFLAPLIHDLSEYDDPIGADAIAPWTALPDLRSALPDDAVAAFALAHVALGKFNAPLPLNRGDISSGAAAALLACGELLYWTSRSDISQTDADTQCSSALSLLASESAYGSVSALYLITGRSTGVRSYIEVLVRFRRHILIACRNALLRPELQIGYFSHFDIDRDRTLSFAIYLVGLIGSEEDLPMLRSMGEHDRYGDASISAIQAIEAAGKLTKP